MYCSISLESILVRYSCPCFWIPGQTTTAQWVAGHGIDFSGGILIGLFPSPPVELAMTKTFMISVMVASILRHGSREKTESSPWIAGWASYWWSAPQSIPDCPDLAGVAKQGHQPTCSVHTACCCLPLLLWLWLGLLLLTPPGFAIRAISKMGRGLGKLREFGSNCVQSWTTLLSKRGLGWRRNLSGIHYLVY